MSTAEYKHAYYKAHPEIWKRLAAKRYKGGKTPVRTGECSTPEGRREYSRQYIKERREHYNALNREYARIRRAKAKAARETQQVLPDKVITARAIQTADNPAQLVTDVLRGRAELARVNHLRAENNCTTEVAG